MEALLKLKYDFSSYIQELKDFHFSLFNPAFWVFLLLLFLVLLKFWRVKRALSFSLIVGVILLGATKIESQLFSLGMERGGFGVYLFRIFTFFIILAVFIYYAFIKEV